MSEHYRKNLAALDKHYPELAARLRRDRSDPFARLTKTPSGFWQLRDDDREAPAGSPMIEAEEYWKRRTLRNPGLMVFLGLDLGYRFAQCLAHPNSDTQGYLVIEKDFEVFRALLHAMSLAEVVADPKVSLVVGVPEALLPVALHHALERNGKFLLIKAAAIESDSVGYRAAPEYYKKALVALRDAATNMLNICGNCPQDSFVGIRNMLLNLETIAREPGISQLFGALPGRPAVIVATGPSLDKNFRLLREIQDRAILISVDASLKFLLEHGIRPHLVVCLERGVETLPFFQGLAPELVRDTVQVTTPVVDPDVYATYAGPKALVYRPLVHFAWLQNEKGTLPSGHSSANLAFKIAATMGCGPIILVGQDLAYADSGETHSTAAYFGTREPTLVPEKLSTLRVRGNVQEWVLTNCFWNLFRAAYERDIVEYGGRVVNATEGGAYIEGTEVLTLREAIDNHIGAPFAPAEEIRKRLRPPSAHEAEAFLARIRGEQAPAASAALYRAAEGFRAQGRTLRAVLEGGAEADACVRALGDCQRYLFEKMFGDPELHQTAYQLLQSSFIQTMVAFYELPNRIGHRQQILLARLELLSRLLDALAVMLDTLGRLYLDPAGTPPP